MFHGLEATAPCVCGGLAGHGNRGFEYISLGWVSIAEPGGVCLSAAAYEQVRGKLDIAVDDMGEQDLKNIARPLRAYRVVF